MIEVRGQAEWSFRWPASGGTREIAWQRNKDRWVSRFKVKPGGWTDGVERTELDSPENYGQARGIARGWAEHHGCPPLRKAIPA